MRIVFRCDPALEPHLPRPVPAREALPRWLADMPRHAVSEAHGTDIRTVKHCPPFTDAMSHGFVLPLPCDINADAGTLSWDWDTPSPAAHAHPRSPLSFHAPAQVEGTPLHTADQAIVKFNSFWTVELEPGWSLFATHPLNRADLPFTTLAGLVDADRYHDVVSCFPRSGATALSPGSSRAGPRSCNASRCGVRRRSWCSTRSIRLASGATTRLPARCSAAPASTASSSARRAHARAMRIARSSPRSSHNVPIGAATSACAIRPNDGGCRR